MESVGELLTLDAEAETITSMMDRQLRHQGLSASGFPDAYANAVPACCDFQILTVADSMYVCTLRGSVEFNVQRATEMCNGWIYVT